jgi:hypothetical protein
MLTILDGLSGAVEQCKGVFDGVVVARARRQRGFEVFQKRSDLFRLQHGGLNQHRRRPIGRERRVGLDETFDGESLGGDSLNVQPLDGDSVGTQSLGDVPRVNHCRRAIARGRTNGGERQ